MKSQAAQGGPAARGTAAPASGGTRDEVEGQGVGGQMKAFRLDELEAQRLVHDGAYLQFLRERNMSVGLYALDRGTADPQKPHRQDEVYFVVSGRGSITVGDETTHIARGSVVYVPAGVPHKFHHITEDLRVMVVFSPPES